MGGGGIPGLSQITSVFMGKPKVQEIQQEYQGGIQTGRGDIATQLASLDRLEQGTAPKGQGLEMGYKDSLNSALENAGISNLTLQPAKEVLFGDAARENFQTAELEKMQKEVFKTPISPNIPLLQTPIAPKKEPYAPPERQEKSAERTLADIEAFKAYGGQTGGMVPDSSRLQETGIGFPAPEVRSALYKQPLAPITEQMQRAKLGAAQGQVPVPQQQNEPAGVPQMYGKPTNEMPKDNIDAKAEPGDVIINNKAMILLGMKNFNKMVGDGVDIVRRMGFTIEERLNKLNKKDIVPLLVSKGEARIPSIIAKAIGMDRLRKINDRGKRAIVAEEKAAAQQKEKQKYTVKKGGVIPQKKAFGDVVESKKKSLNELEPHKKEFITNAHQVVNEVNIDNIIPSPIILSMVALETGYGTSRFANEGNNWLSLAVNKPDQEFLAAKKRPSQKLRSFNNPAESIQAFLDMVKNAEHYAPVRDTLTKYATGEASEHDIIDSIASTKYAEDPEWSNKIKSVHDGRIKNMFTEQKQQVQ